MGWASPGWGGHRPCEPQRPVSQGGPPPASHLQLCFFLTGTLGPLPSWGLPVLACVGLSTKPLSRLTQPPASTVPYQPCGVSRQQLALGSPPSRQGLRTTGLYPGPCPHCSAGPPPSLLPSDGSSGGPWAHSPLLCLQSASGGWRGAGGSGCITAGLRGGERQTHARLGVAL